MKKFFLKIPVYTLEKLGVYLLITTHLMDPKLDFDSIMQRADELYATEKLGPETLKYTAPEVNPTIQSDQVKCVLKALIEAINETP